MAKIFLVVQDVSSSESGSAYVPLSSFKYRGAADRYIDELIAASAIETKIYKEVQAELPGSLHPLRASSREADDNLVCLRNKLFEDKLQMIDPNLSRHIGLMHRSMWCHRYERDELEIQEIDYVE